MRLDSAAQRALNVMKQRTDANDSFSLYGIMNRGRTAMAKRLLKVWLKQPLVHFEEIRTRHDIVEAFVSDPSLRDRLRDACFRGMPDIERLTRKLERGKTSLADLCQLYRASSKLPSIESALRAHEGPTCKSCSLGMRSPWRKRMTTPTCPSSRTCWRPAVDLDRIPDEYLICASYDPALEELQGDKERHERAINKAAREIADDLGLVLD
eukprot:jgi/Botrbrau1/5336/Bobra.0346s0010.1